MRQHELSFANLIVRFGLEAALLDYAEEIVLPAFLGEQLAREYGETTYRLFGVELTRLDTEGNVPVLALSGHFIKDTILRRHQVFRPKQGLIEDEAAIESAPSSYFVLVLNNHRLLYFAETAAAPTIESFGATVQFLLRARWHRYIRERRDHLNVTRRGVERLSVRDLQRQLPPPFVSVVKVAGQDEIADSIDRFQRITSLRIDLIQPNEETDASKAISSVEKLLRPTDPSSLYISATKTAGLEKPETKEAVEDLTRGQNAHITVSGYDEQKSKIKADNDEFALSVPIKDPPENDNALRKFLWAIYKKLTSDGKVHRPPTPSHMEAKLKAIETNAS